MKKTKQENIFSSRTLSYFLQLAETMNYTQAAQILGITQPALTQQIKKLERTVGAPLFYSIGKKLKLSAAGEIMLKSTKEIYEILNNTADEIEQSNSSNSGDINIGVLASVQVKVFEQFIAKVYQENPGLKINLRMLTRKEIWESLESNNIDLAIMYLPDSSIKNWKTYDFKKIISDDLMYIHHNKNLSGENKVKLSDTLDKPWVTYPEGYFLDIILNNEYKDQLVNRPKSVACFSTPSQILRFSMETGLNTALPGSFMIDKDAKKLEDSNTWVSKLNPNINFDLAFVYRHNKRAIPRVSAFLSSFDEFLREKDYSSRLKEK